MKRFDWGGLLKLLGVLLLAAFFIGYLGWYFSTCLRDMSATLAHVPTICLLLK